MNDIIPLKLKKLSDQELLRNTKALARQEREILIQVLHHLREVERRKLYCDLKCKSLFEYATRELGYADDAAYRRINAMRLLQELPQIEKKIESGALTLSTLCVATTAIRAETKQKGVVRKLEEKLSLLSQLENKSRREAEVIVVKVANIPKAKLSPERVRVVDDQVELRFMVPSEVEAKIKRIKGLLAHARPDLSTGGLFEKLCDDYLAKHEKSLAARKSQSGARLLDSDLSLEEKHSAESLAAPKYEPKEGPFEKNHSLSEKPDFEKRRSERHIDSDACFSASGPLRTITSAPATSETPTVALTPQKPASHRTRFIPAAVKKAVWQNAQSRCQNCGSQHALQIDHCKPWGMGEDNSPANLRLLCRACNQRAAIKFYGKIKMQRFTDRSSSL